MTFLAMCQEIRTVCIQWMRSITVMHFKQLKSKVEFDLSRAEHVIFLILFSQYTVKFFVVEF